MYLARHSALMSGKFDMYLMGKYLMPGVFTQMTPKHPEHPRARIASIFILQARYQSMNNGDYNSAIPYLDSALSLAPQNYMAYAMRAKCYYQLIIKTVPWMYIINTYKKPWQILNMAISFQPAEAELYGMRRNIFADISLVATSQADHEYLQNAAVDNDRNFFRFPQPWIEDCNIRAFLAFDLIHVGAMQKRDADRRRSGKKGATRQ